MLDWWDLLNEREELLIKRAEQLESGVPGRTQSL